MTGVFAGFWSYVHADDEAERGRIADLARDVIAEYRLVTGDPIELFLDTDDLQWGDEWRRRIDESLAGVAYFIPVLTPRYFASAECRRELQSVARRAKELGISGLILPLKYVDVPALNETDPDDDLARLVKELQWRDWTDLRFADRDSENYRRGVAGLVVRLVDANAEADRADIAEAVTHLEESLAGEEGEAPGWLDRMAASEAALPEWGKTLEAITPQVQAIGRIMEEGTQAVKRADARGQGTAARLTIARQTAQKLEDPSQEVQRLGAQLATQMHTVDDGTRLMIERISTEVQQDPSATEATCAFFQAIRQFAERVAEGAASTRTMIESQAPLEAMSRDLRRPLRKLREGLTAILEAHEIVDGWVHLVNQSGLECD